MYDHISLQDPVTLPVQVQSFQLTLKVRDRCTHIRFDLALVFRKN